MFIYWIWVRLILRSPRSLDAVDLLSIPLSNCTIYPIYLLGIEEKSCLLSTPTRIFIPFLLPTTQPQRYNRPACTHPRLLLYPPPRMPNPQNPHSNHNGRKLQCPEKGFVRAQIPKDALGSLRQAEYGAEIDQEAGDCEGEEKGAFAGYMRAESLIAVERYNEHGEKREEDGKRKRLEHQSSKQNIIWHHRAFLMRLGTPDHAGASNLQNSRNNITSHKTPQDQLWP